MINITTQSITCQFVVQFPMVTYLKFSEIRKASNKRDWGTFQVDYPIVPKY